MRPSTAPLLPETTFWSSATRTSESSSWLGPTRPTRSGRAPTSTSCGKRKSGCTWTARSTYASSAC